MSRKMKELIALDRLRIDGRSPGEVTAIQATISKDGDNLVTVFFNANGKPRVITVEAEAVSIGLQKRTDIKEGDHDNA